MSHVSSVEVPGKVLRIPPNLHLALGSEGTIEDKRKRHPPDQVVCQAGPSHAGRKVASSRRPEHPGSSENLPQQPHEDNRPVAKWSTCCDEITDAIHPDH